jgi:hypothetical protein
MSEKGHELQPFSALQPAALGLHRNLKVRGTLFAKFSRLNELRKTSEARMKGLLDR